ncbi:HAD family hydrolase [Vulcanisaeta distributa]|uniref:phosphoserine phosphatase n=1 Tax=Vulcanisaeta distributa (strain DSM 14429 / JCM 11212 / NBRC 100878 / IC-017) TaxID=572478 RepID=E1QNF8_VULDI|nr:HAD-IB family phosphatase [Vulcanisaeta distributa]ADN50128.1 HAD-superfamily hydrolase, subfamily IB (PSPase-like) [Vulcanisaeta distributa DSM 14429]
MIKAAILDVDGVLTYFRSAWQHLHKVLGTDEWASVNRDAYKAGLINYRDWALVDALLWMDVPRTWVEVPITLRRGTLELLRFLRDNNVLVIAVSGGLNYTGIPIRDYVNYFISNELVYDENGSLVSVRVNVENKDIVNELVSELGLDWDYVMAVGDSDMDLPMLRKARYSIAYNPVNDEVANAARIVINSDTLYPLIDIARAILSR